MTKEDAITACQQHAADIKQLGILMALSGLSFAVVGTDVEKELGLPNESLAAALIVPQRQLLSAISDYVAVLENAAKGQLASVAEEWEEVIDN